MKKLFVALCLSLLMFGAVHAEEVYDPLHTLLALNMARASVIKILKTKDKIVLEQEYQNIINNLNFGNIEDDKDIKDLYNDLMDAITNKDWLQEKQKKIQENYVKQEEETLRKTVDSIITSDKDLFSSLENLATSCVSLYFGYYDLKSKIEEEMQDELWRLKEEDIKIYNDLQKRLFHSSWSLVGNEKYNEYLKKYFIEHFQSDQHMVVDMEELKNFYDALDIKDLKSRIEKLRIYEFHLYAYPPYWCYRAKTAQELHYDEEAHSCFEKFNKVWRPVLAHDPYKVEELKFRITEILNSKNLTNEAKHEAFRLLNEMMFHLPSEDWANHIFAGTTYFSLGSRDKGIAILKAHPTVEICKTLLDDFQLKDALIKYFEGNEAEAEKILESMSKTIENPVVLQILAYINASQNYVKFAKFKKRLDDLEDKGKAAYFAVQPLVESYAEKQVPLAEALLGEIYVQRGNNTEAMKWYQKSAEHGFCIAQNDQGVIYKNSKNYMEARKWFSKAAYQGFALSQYNLGTFFEYAYEGKQNYVEAVNWYRKAADQGYAAAQNELGAMYLLGHGVRKNPDEAVRLFRLAAEQGLAEAQENLGNMYFDALYVDVEGKKHRLYKEAYMWYSLSVLCGRPKTENMIKIEGEKGIFWNDASLIPDTEINEAKAEAQRKYDEIRKRYGLD